MLVYLRTDVGLHRLINTDDVSFVESQGDKSSRIYLRTQLDFPVRVDLGLKDLHLVLKGEKEFDEVYLPPKVDVYQDDARTIKELNKEVQPPVVAEKVEVQQTRTPSAPAKVEVPTFSKKKIANKPIVNTDW
jgi:hypothetical protein